jgi:hypothetical protein
MNAFMQERLRIAGFLRGAWCQTRVARGYPAYGKDIRRGDGRVDLPFSATSC